MRDERTSDRSTAADGPRSLPYCDYPRSRDVACHGLQPLPTSLPLVNFTQAGPYRSQHYRAIPAAQLAPAQVLEMARVNSQSRVLGIITCSIS